VQRVRHIPDLDHFGHVTSMRACEPHVKVQVVSRTSQGRKSGPKITHSHRGHRWPPRRGTSRRETIEERTLGLDSRRSRLG
jgi:hypothetical protein